MSNKEVAILTILLGLLTFFVLLAIIFMICAAELVGQIPSDNGKVIIEKE